MDHVASIGKKLTGMEVKDAVHIAIAPVVAGDNLSPGQRVRVVYICGKARVYDASECYPCDGVIDPYLQDKAREGELVWLFLNPGSITGLRHDWTHPAFTSPEASSDRADSERWLRDYAARYGGDYDEMVTGAITGEGYCFGDDDGPPQYRGAESDFWRHIENVAGRRFTQDHRDNTTFRCSC